MGAFEEVILPKGERTIGLKWVFDIKTDADGQRIHGKEKARLVAQGFIAVCIKLVKTQINTKLAYVYGQKL